ncbi:unnamed protein product [Toxocara canis]|uniref:CUB domain-containing protein n=1 Tax=Toxocara canis TaxID=6265 RepID=A0A183V6T5_TOXCA|nr:unnamed protein product [Toxocara canis]
MYASFKQAYSPGCGDILRAEKHWQVLNATLGDLTLRDDMSYCYWWIMSKDTEEIEVRIDRLDGLCSEGCIYGGLELKALFDKRTTGYRFCCGHSSGTFVTASGPNLPVILFNRKFYTSFVISYRVSP